MRSRVSSFCAKQYITEMLLQLRGSHRWFVVNAFPSSSLSVRLMSTIGSESNTKPAPEAPSAGGKSRQESQAREEAGCAKTVAGKTEGARTNFTGLAP
jgi:hypothetical protein